MQLKDKVLKSSKRNDSAFNFDVYFWTLYIHQSITEIIILVRITDISVH